jgi:hypothetical protein
MARIANLTQMTIKLLNWRILGGSNKALNPQGKLVDWIPEEIAFSPQAKRLADQGFLRIEGYTPKKPKPSPDTPLPSATVEALKQAALAKSTK